MAAVLDEASLERCCVPGFLELESSVIGERLGPLFESGLGFIGAIKMRQLWNSGRCYRVNQTTVFVLFLCILVHIATLRRHECDQNRALEQSLQDKTR